MKTTKKPKPKKKWITRVTLEKLLRLLYNKHKRENLRHCNDYDI